MLENYITLYLRNLSKYKLIAFINIIGLSLGLLFAIWVYLFVLHEMRYDKFNENYDRIYRVLRYYKKEGKLSAGTSSLEAQFIRKFGDDIEKTVRMRNNWIIPLTIGNNKYISENLFFADKELLQIFSFDVYRQMNNNLLNNPNSLILSKSAALKYFGTDDCLGKTVQIDVNDGKYLLTVEGVYSEISGKSHFQADVIIPLSRLKKLGAEFVPDNEDGWTDLNYNTYFLLKKGSDIDNLEKSLNESDLTKISSPGEFKYKIQPMSKIRLYSKEINEDIAPQGDISYLLMLISVAAAILLISISNFIILSTARASLRAKEVGIRKTFGAERKEIASQMLGESVFTAFLAFPIALILSYVALPFFNNITNNKLQFDMSFGFIGGIIIITIIVGVLSGSYSAFYVASFNPVQILRSRTNNFSGKSWLKKILISLQVVTFIILSVYSMTISRQINYLKNKSLGFKKEGLIYLGELPPEKFEVFRSELMKDPRIINITSSNIIPPGNDALIADNKSIMMVDYNYIKTLGIKLKAGRDFFKEYAADSTLSVILNEAAVNELQLKSPVGAKISVGGKRTVIGIVYNFHFRTLFENIKPIYMVITPKDFAPLASKTAIRIRQDNVPEVIKIISEKYKKVFNNSQFEYTFLEDKFNSQYKSQEKHEVLIKYCSGVAIFLAALGLFGLSAFTAERRKKEIGIRKVMGASEFHLMRMLLSEILLLVILSNPFAWVFSSYIVSNWLERFPYRTNLSFSIFLTAAMISIVIAVITVSYFTLKAVKTNPIDIIKED